MGVIQETQRLVQNRGAWHRKSPRRRSRCCCVPGHAAGCLPVAGVLHATALLHIAMLLRAVGQRIFPSGRTALGPAQ